MARQTLVAQFESRADAENALEDLVAAGIDRNDIHLHTNGSASAEVEGESHKGFWGSLADFFMPDDDRNLYDEGVRRGGATLAVSADEIQVDDVADILERHNAIDMDERESSWRSEGWAPTSPAATATAPVAPVEAPRAAAGGLHDAEAIPLAEEKLRVGKRQVNEGRVRVRSYVVETPVEEQVALREENVSVGRRPVDRPAGAGDDAFRERTIEAEEVNEEAVVAKEARVKEELVVNKDVGERTETVKDTVRHTEVDVEDTRKKTR